MKSSSASGRAPSAQGPRETSRPYVSESRRERLREAMVRVAAEKGYAATTVSDVVEAAGVSEDDFHELFEGKEACFLEAFGAVNDVVVAHVSSAYEAAADAPWPQRVAVALRALIELLAAESDVARMTMVEVTAAGDEGRLRYGVALSRFAGLLDEGREYSDQKDLPADTAKFAVGAATSMIFDEIRAGRGPELDRILPSLVFTVLMPFLGPEGAEVEMRRLQEAAG